MRGAGARFSPALLLFSGVDARIRLDSGHRFNSASRYIEERGDEPMAAQVHQSAPQLQDGYCR